MFDRIVIPDAGDIFFQSDPFRSCNAFEDKASPCSLSIFQEDERYLTGIDPNLIKCSSPKHTEDYTRFKTYALWNFGFIVGKTPGILSFLKLYVPILLDFPKHMVILYIIFFVLVSFLYFYL